MWDRRSWRPPDDTGHHYDASGAVTRRSRSGTACVTHGFRATRWAPNPGGAPSSDCSFSAPCSSPARPADCSGDFYLRRAFRIFPVDDVYLALIFALTVVGYVALRPYDAVFALTYTMNYHYDRAWHVGHSWFLSVEEQFDLHVWHAIAGETLVDFLPLFLSSCGMVQ